MEQLPPEIFRRAISFLHMHKTPLAALTTTSRLWQNAIEPITFRELKLFSGDFAMFKTTFCRSGCEYRQTILRSLWFEVTLSPYTDEACAEYENDKDREDNSVAFSRDLSNLLDTLANFRPDGTTVSLRIGAFSPMDEFKQSREMRKQRRDAINAGTRKDLLNARFRNSYLALNCSLPASIPCVTHLTPPGKSDRAIHPADLVALSGVFPRLQSLHWPFNDSGIYLSRRRQHYRDLSRALVNFCPSRETVQARIQIESPEWRNWKQLPNLAQPFGQDSDCVSTCVALREIIGQSKFKSMLYKGLLDPTFFWDDGTETENDTYGHEDHTSWDTLENLEIESPMHSLSGKWYFGGNANSTFYRENSDITLPAPDPGAGLSERAEVGELMPPGYGSDGNREDEAAKAWADSMAVPIDFEGLVVEGADFRNTPRDSAMLPLLKAVARRLARGAPSLNVLDLRCKIPAPIIMWTFSFCAPGHISNSVPPEDDQTEIGRPRVFLHTGKWRPDAESMALLKDIGKTRYGEDAPVIFLCQAY